MLRERKTKPKLDPQELLRRRRERAIIVFVAFLIVALTLLESYLSRTGGHIFVSSNIVVYFLLNLNILLLVLLLFLVIRNVVKLVFERRRGILGSKLRTKLVASFIGLTLVPTLLLFWISANFVANTIDNWFSFRLERSLQQSLEVAQTYYQDLTDRALFFAKTLSTVITRQQLLDPPQRPLLRGLIERKLVEYNAGSIEVFSSAPRHSRLAVASQLALGDKAHTDPKLVPELFAGKEDGKIETIQEGDLVRGAFPIRGTRDRKRLEGVVVVTFFLPQSLVGKMSGISEAFSDYKRLRLTQPPIKANYILVLSIVTLLIIFSAITFGFHLAKNITGPIKELAEGTQEVANGNLDVHIDVVRTDDEIGSLVESFNKMTQDLKANASQLGKMNLDLRETNVELDQRRKYMEIILENVAAGVISLDSDGRITTINKSVGKILGLEVDTVLGKSFREVLPAKYLRVVEELLQGLDFGSTLTFEKEIRLPLPAKVLDLSVFITPLQDENEKYLGLVIVLEDVTELQKAQRIAAWREVARRIAHEIKNPLTPIQLSAQRLRRRYKDRFSEDGQIFDECTNTIISQVELLKNTVNEFYTYARMPSTRPSANDLNQIVNETLLFYRAAHTKIAFSVVNGENLPMMKLDKDQIKRALINILDNAVAAVDATGAVTITTFFDRKAPFVGIEIADNGCGIPPEGKARLFEPYFSTKKSGTGLGLSIVQSIISDHRGRIRVRDNHPRGTIFRIELPVDA